MEKPLLDEVFLTRLDSRHVILRMDWSDDWHTATCIPIKGMPEQVVMSLRKVIRRIEDRMEALKGVHHDVWENGK